MKSLGMIEVFSFTTASVVADLCAKVADVKVIAMDRNRPLSASAPAPLIMIVKIEGDVSAVEAAVRVGENYAKEQGKFVVSHIIANPGEDVDLMAYKMDINKDKFNKKLPKSFLGQKIENKRIKGSFGFVEVQGLVASIEGLDTMLKTADVRLVHTEKRLGGRLVTYVITGSVSAVKSAVEAGVNAASKLGKVYGEAVIASPHEELVKFFDCDVE